MTNRTSKYASIDACIATLDLEGQSHKSISSAAQLAQSCAADLPLSVDFSSQDHCLSVLEILLDLDVDAETIQAALLLYASRSGCIQIEAIKNDYSHSVVSMVTGLLRIVDMEKKISEGHDRQSLEGLRRLLLVLVDDVRGVLIILADMLTQLRAVAYGPEDIRMRLANETYALYAPIANRLGIWQLKWELEDFSFRYREPAIYKRIAKLLAERRNEREDYIDKLIHDLQNTLEQARIKASIAGRPKHIYSIWRKMHRKNLGFHQLYDVRALRVLVDDVATCYATLGIVHAIWQHIPKEFDDYIATPKGNNYQALHTAVMGPEGKTIEVQVKTFAMHSTAELGVAAHWRYKERSGSDPAFDKKILAMRYWLESSKMHPDDKPSHEQLLEAAEDRVYVLTPKGKVIDLEKGSTVLDFAYHVHTDVGNKCRGAKVEGRIVPLSYQVSTGEKVEILTAKNGQPSRDWLSAQLGYLRNASSRAKVRQWFRKKDYRENLLEGKELLEKELERLGLNSVDLNQVLKRFNLQLIDNLYAQVGRGETSPLQVANAAEDILNPAENRKKILAPTSSARSNTDPDAIYIEGVGNLLSQVATCCQPLPGDPIIGYITRGKGITVHRLDCSNIARFLSQDHPRLIQVSWGEDSPKGYCVDVSIAAYDRKGLVQDISTVLSNEKSHIIAIKSEVDNATGTADIYLSLEILDVAHLAGLLRKLNGIPNVVEAKRRRN